VRAGLTEGLEAGLAVEREEFLALLRSDESAALIHLFHAEAAARRRFHGGHRRPWRVGVVGAGQMGAGIAATAVGHGLSAVVRDIDPDRIAEARARADAAGGGSWEGTTGWEGFGDVDVVVEAVFELPELKRETLALLDGEVGSGTLITTNTSAIQVASLAGALSRPEAFLGTHFFSPVEKMPLVELVPHDRTSNDALDRAGAISRSLGKVPVVVADHPGFFTSRVYARWILEGIRLVIDGADPADVERGAREAGFPLGPLQACDEVTLELVRQASVIQVAERVLIERFDVAQLKQVLGALIDAGHKGKRAGKGFYRYTDGRRGELDATVVGVVDAIAPASGPAPDARLAGERLLLAFVTEALLCWDDGTLCHPDDGDVASVLGIGFPRALGGPFHWVDRQGPAVVVARCEAVGAQAFPVSQALARLAGSAGRFLSEARRDRPGLLAAGA
jgi:3-hydroxyacyl-CoA dehydrogenase/enoyl-CoA hydratase/3-hydroxybutyryl-CoA epimerase